MKGGNITLVESLTSVASKVHIQTSTYTIVITEAAKFAKDVLTACKLSESEESTVSTSCNYLSVPQRSRILH